MYSGFAVEGRFSVLVVVVFFVFFFLIINSVSSRKYFLFTLLQVCISWSTFIILKGCLKISQLLLNLPIKFRTSPYIFLIFWRFFIFSIIVDLQCSVNFCSTAKWPSHTHTHTHTHAHIHTPCGPHTTHIPHTNHTHTHTTHLTPPGHSHLACALWGPWKPWESAPTSKPGPGMASWEPGGPHGSGQGWRRPEAPTPLKLRPGSWCCHQPAVQQPRQGSPLWHWPGHL